MALDETVHRFVNELLEVRLIYLVTSNVVVPKPLPVGTINMRLSRLWSYSDLVIGGVGRIESLDHPLNGLWLIFSNGDRETFNFTDKLTRYQVHVHSQEPVDNAIRIPTNGIPLMGGFAQIAAVGTGPIPPRYSAATLDLQAQLGRIPTACDGFLAYRPCDVVLEDGRRVDRVYVVPEEPYILSWSPWPEEDRGKNAIRIDDLAAVEESRHRLPAPFATRLYAAGESGMGYTIFTVFFDDGSRIAIRTGNAIDFIDYPPGKGPVNVVDVLPHFGRDDPDLRRGPEYSWCLYSD